jgi:hypothetical protein
MRQHYVAVIHKDGENGFNTSFPYGQNPQLLVTDGIDAVPLQSVC